nr:YidB family protein [Plastoroseomonas arctica]
MAKSSLFFCGHRTPSARRGQAAGARHRHAPGREACRGPLLGQHRREAVMSQGGLGGMFGQLMGGREDGAGLENLLGKLRQQGLGDEVDSWVSTGPNRAVAREQIQAAFGQERLDSAAQQFGMPSGALGGILAQLLPELVNRLTPNGQVPQQLPGGMGGLGGIAASILGGLLSGGMGGGGQGGGGLGSILGGLFGGGSDGGAPMPNEATRDAPRDDGPQELAPNSDGGPLSDLMRGLNRGR